MGTVVAPEQTNGQQGYHMLECEWTLWYDKREFKPTTTATDNAAAQSWDSNLQSLGTFNSIEDFWRHYNHVNKPSQIPLNANYHLFKAHVKPMWEDEANKNGGKWILTLKTERDKLDIYWENLVLAMVGETLDDDITGAVMSRRKAADKIAVWNRQKGNKEAVLQLGKKLREALQLPADLKIEYMFHEDSLKSGTSYQTPVRYEL